MRLIDGNQFEWQNRGHFFGVAASVMRRIPVDGARRKAFVTREGGAYRRTFDEAAGVSPKRSGNVVALDDALEAPAKVDARTSQVIELRLFGGLAFEKTAEVLKVSPQTVLRDWNLAKAWLARELKRSGNHGS